MNHLPYILGAYAFALALALWLAISAWARVTRAERRLAALDVRAAARERLPRGRR